MATATFPLTHKLLAVSDIHPDPAQPRKKISEQQDAGLRESMEASGLLQPLMVRKDGDRYVIVHGERRWRQAVQLKQDGHLNWATIDCMVIDVDSNRALFLQFIENIQREDLSPEDMAAHLKKLVAQLEENDDQKYTIKLLAGMIGKSPGWVSEKLALSRLPPSIHAMKSSGEVKNARVLIGLAKLHEQNPAAAERIISEIKESGKTVSVDVINEVRGKKRNMVHLPRPHLRTEDIPEELRAPKAPAADDTTKSLSDTAAAASAEAAPAPTTKPPRKKKIRDVASLIGATEDMDDATLLEAFAEAYLKLREEAAVMQ